MDVAEYTALCETRVRRGIAFCEATDTNWLPSLNLDTLDIRDNCGCVIGQRYGEYTNGLNALGVKADRKLDIAVDDTFGWAVDHGFDLPDEFLRAIVNGKWTDGVNISHKGKASTILTDTWKRLIQERRDQVQLHTEPLSTETERCLATAG